MPGLRRGCAASRRLLLSAVVLLLAAALAVQTAYALRLETWHVRHRNDEGEAAIAIRLARMVPAGAKYTATSLGGRTFTRYALYPDPPVHVPFVGRSEVQVRTDLAALGVQYVLVVSPVTPRYLQGQRSWYDVMARHDHPLVLLLRLLG